MDVKTTPEQRTAPKRQRMTRIARREQLIGIARKLFAAHGYDAVSIEEIASAADVSKPVIYEHFGGKEGLYQVIVDRETTAVNAILEEKLTGDVRPRQALELVVMGLLDYIELNPDGFGLMVHQSPEALAGGYFSTIMSDMGEILTNFLSGFFASSDFDTESLALYAHMLSGLVGIMGQSWAISREPSKEIMAAHLVNLMWNGLHNLEATPSALT